MKSDSVVCWAPPPAPEYLKPGDGHPETPHPQAGSAPYTAERVGGSANYERCATGVLSTKTLPGDVNQFRSADPADGVSFRAPL